MDPIDVDDNEVVPVSRARVDTRFPSGMAKLDTQT